MTSLQVRNTVLKTVYMWYWTKPLQLRNYYKKRAVSGSQAVYDDIKDELSITIESAEDKLTFVLSKDENSCRVVYFPKLAKREVFKKGTSKEKIAGFALSETLSYFGLK